MTRRRWASGPGLAGCALAVTAAVATGATALTALTARPADAAPGASAMRAVPPAPPVPAAPPGSTTATAGRDLGREALDPNDGWASAEGGTTGGASAEPARVHYVRDREQLVAALGGQTDATPKIIHVVGTIDGNVDVDDKPLTCDDYAAGTGYDLPGYLAAYDPATWGRTERPSGPLETARVAAEKRQAERVQIPVPSNTTIVGHGRDAILKGINLMVDARDRYGAADNIIIRNLTFQNTYDCFPQWDPTDGATGNWNSRFDSVTIWHAATHVWLDHNTFTDRPDYDDQAPEYFGRPFQRHDGASEVTHGADFVTVSWNRYEHHDKLMLIGSTDGTRYNDGEHLRVTVHHNLFRDIGQRAPRVRWNQTDIYNNHYVQTGRTRYDYSYSWGVGYRSRVYAEKNHFALPAGIDPGEVIKDWGGDSITARDNMVNGRTVDLVQAHNTANAGDLGTDSGWTPVLRTRVHPVEAVPGVVGSGAGAGRLR